MSDVDEGRVGVGVQSLELDSHLEPELGVQVRKRLVHEEDLGFRCQGSGDCDTLLLSAGELCRVTLVEFLDFKHCKHFLDPCLDFGLGPFEVLESEGDVLVNGHVRPQCVVLEQESDVSLCGREVDLLLRVEYDRVSDGDAALGRCLEAGDHSQRGGLSASGRTEQNDEFAVFDDHVQVFDRCEFLESFRYMFKYDFRHISFLPLPCRCLLRSVC